MDVDKGGLEMEKSKFRQFLVVPDVIDEAPGEVCDVVFPSGVSAILGSELLPEEVRQAPKVNYTVEKDALYSLIIADADTQNPDKNEGLTQWQQWVVVNIPGAHVEQGQVLSEYIGSGPLPGSGLHRYVVLVFKQPQRLQPKEPYFSENEGDRKGFSIRDFIKKYQLPPPFAGNFYQAKYDDSVKDLYNEKNAANQPK